jgi:hypothetical protein
MVAVAPSGFEDAVFTRFVEAHHCLVTIHRRGSRRLQCKTAFADTKLPPIGLLATPHIYS